MILQKLRGLSATVALGVVLTAGVPAIVGSIAQAATTTLHASAAVNVRTGPGTSNARIGVLYPGDEVAATGSSVDGWTPVTYQGRKAWVSTRYLAGGGYTPDTTTTSAAGSAWTTANLNLRAGAGASQRVIATLPRGTEVTRTGKVSGEWTAVTSDKGSGWVHGNYLSASQVTAVNTSKASSAPVGNTAPTGKAAPSTVGTRYATTTLNLWTAATGSRYVGTVDRGTALKYTGTVSNGRTQVVVKGAARWVTSDYLSASRPSSRKNSSAASRSSSRSGEGQATTTGSCRASYYDEDQLTANGERFNTNDYTAAHKTLKFNTRVRVTNPANGKSTVVRINDRGPYVSGRCLDLSTAAFSAIASTGSGVIAVKYTVLG
ncbi:septal ring lytic transglycosylase RlpA family protein [Acidipropionibacterium virtanenii]|uniref:Probable endolytic peptidoglycan transglycosylase RlpA n=1 Tax=Acidipropionibacterium virtanenii TaxID=2057246 RepID=A0A344UQ40_9ACTN|nr:septal ring lytic transglycosylase RlpA family protein [Acidipropionibacterium virtanenii]AXE37388.1 Endolytic peptidoglycan transglycosylase RlpA [Acidipropionibacterium virtanenii]